MLSEAMMSPEASSFCRQTAARLFGMFRTDPIESAFEVAESLPDRDKKRQVVESTLSLARELRTAVVHGLRQIYKVKYSNHEFVVTVRNQRAELFQSLQFRYGVGDGVDYTKSFADGEIEYYLANIAQGGKIARDVQRAAFGYDLSPDLAIQATAVTTQVGGRQERPAWFVRWLSAFASPGFRAGFRCPCGRTLGTSASATRTRPRSPASS